MLALFYYAFSCYSAKAVEKIKKIACPIEIFSITLPCSILKVPGGIEVGNTYIMDAYLPRWSFSVYCGFSVDVGISK